MTSSQVAVESGLRQILESADGDYVALYKHIVGEEGQKAIASAPQSSVEQRKKVWKDAVALLDRHLLAKINKTMKSYLQVVRRNAPVTARDEPGELTPAEAKELMTEFMDLKEIEVFLKARREDIKRSVFGHLTEEAATAGEDFPEYSNGSLNVPELGQRFAREAGGPGEAGVDEHVLRSLLGEDRWDQVTETEVIPAQEVTKLSIEKVMEMAVQDPNVLELLRKSVTVGKFREPRMFLRKL